MAWRRTMMIRWVWSLICRAWWMEYIANLRCIVIIIIVANTPCLHDWSGWKCRYRIHNDNCSKLNDSGTSDCIHVRTRKTKICCQRFYTSIISFLIRMNESCFYNHSSHIGIFVAHVVLFCRNLIHWNFISLSEIKMWWPERLGQMFKMNFKNYADPKESHVEKHTTYLLFKLKHSTWCGKNSPKKMSNLPVTTITKHTQTKQLWTGKLILIHLKPQHASVPYQLNFPVCIVDLRRNFCFLMF